MIVPGSGQIIIGSGIPSGLTAVSDPAGGAMNLSWVSFAGPTYNLYYSTTPGVTVLNGTKVAGVTSAYHLTGLTNGTTYYFILTSVNRGTESSACPQVSATVADPHTWTTRTSAGNNVWRGIAYNGSIFAATAYTSSDNNHVMTSPDGITWTAHPGPQNTNQWLGVCWGNGLFVAVSNTGTQRVMTSPDGITWTLRSTPTNSGGRQLTWINVCYGNGQFVAVANGDDVFPNVLQTVMTSPDGITWTLQNAASANRWSGVAWNGATFVAVASDSYVMTSPDGVTWTSRTPANANSWGTVCWGNGLFVSVSYSSSSSYQVMTSPDGVTWTQRSTPVTHGNWYGVTAGNGGFVAVSYDTANPQVMYSPDGINWTTTAASIANQWWAVAYGAGLYAAVAGSGTGTRVMTGYY